MEREDKLLSANSNNNTVSVIVPVFNAQKHLAQCLDSIKNQTFSNLEILLIDDGSTDGSGAICDSFAAEDSRFRVFHTENGGVSAARNIGLSKRTGNWISFADADDVLHPDCIETMLDIALEKQTDFVKCNYRTVCESGGNSDCGNGAAKKANTETITLDEHFAFDKRYILMHVWGSLISSRAVDGVMFDTDIFIGEDALFVCEVFSRIKSLYYTDAVLYDYRYSADSAFHSDVYSYKKDTDIAAWEKIGKLFEHCPKAYRYSKACIGVCAFKAAKRAARHSRSDDYKAFVRIMRKHLPCVITFDLQPVAKFHYVLCCVFPYASAAVIKH